MPPVNLSFTSSSCFLYLTWSTTAACAIKELVPRSFPLLRVPSVALRALGWLGQDLVGRRSREVLLSPFPTEDALQMGKKNSFPIRREHVQCKYQLLDAALPGLAVQRWQLQEVGKESCCDSSSCPSSPQVPSRQEEPPASSVPSRFPSIPLKPRQLSRKGLYQSPGNSCSCAGDGLCFLVIACEELKSAL